MKHSSVWKLLLTLLLVIGMAVPVLVACNKTPADPVDTDGTGSSTEAPGETTGAFDTLPPVDTETLLKDQTRFTVESGDSVLKLGISGNSLFVIGAQTKANEKNRIDKPIPLGLPKQYKKGASFKPIAWTYEGYYNYRPTDAKYDLYGYVFHFSCANLDLTYDIYVTATYRFDGPFAVTGYLYNNAKKPLTVLPEDYFNVSTQGENVPHVWSFAKESGAAEGWKLYDGTYFAGSGIYKTLMKSGAKVNAMTTTNQGWNCGGELPMIYVDHGSKHGMYYGMEWSNCHITAKSEKGGGSVTIAAGLGERKFFTTMAASSSLYLPTVYMGVYDGDVDDGSNIFKRWFLYNRSPEIILEDKNEPLTQEDLQHGITSSRFGIQSVKWDYGWWSGQVAPGQTRWQTKEGLLELEWNTGYAGQLKKLGMTSMKEYAEAIERNGLKWAVYVLLKDCGLDREGVPTSVGKHGHPEWFSNRVITVGKSADLGNVDCVAFFQKYLLNFFKESGVHTWRSDFEPICYSSDKKNRHDANGNDVQYWCTVGFLEVVDYLYENLDYFRYESCSSGGSMKDLLTATRAVVINCDDSADFQSLKMSFYDSSYVIHPTQLQLPTNCLTYVHTSKYYTGVGDYVYGLRSQLVGGVMLCNWEGGRDIETAYWLKYLTVYNSRIKPLIRNGDLYHIFDRPDGVHWDGLAYIDADAESSTKGVVMLWKPTEQDGDSKTIKLKGLDASATYQVKFHDRSEQTVTMTGKELMEKGFTAKLEGKCASEWVWIVEK